MQYSSLAMRSPPPSSILVLLASSLWFSAADAAGDAEVFDLGSKLDSFDYSVMLTIVIVGLVMFDVVVEMYEHYLHHHKRRFHQKLFNKAVKELMILGLISFVLFILKDQAVVDQSDYVLTNTFDFVNLFLFFVGVSFVLAAVLMVLATSPLKRRWDMYANVPLQRLLNMHEEMTNRGWKWYAAWPPRLFTGIRQAQVLEYHLFRSVFLRLNRSLLTPAFDFSKYSSAIVDELIVVFFDVGWASWLLAVVALFFTLPISTASDGSESVSAHGAISFGVFLILLEVFICAYCNFAHQKVIQRMGVVGGFAGIGTVVKELWVEPRHYMGQETAAIDVKELLLAAPVQAPTRDQLTSIGGAESATSRAQVNFKAGRSSSTSSSWVKSKKSSSVRSSSVNENAGPAPAVATIDSAPAFASASASASVPASALSGVEEGEPKPSMGVSAAAPVPPTCPENDPDRLDCEASDPLWLPPGRVQECSMGGDPFILAKLRPPQRIMQGLPEILKEFEIRVGSYMLFQTLFGMSTLLKCYYCAFYFSYAIGRATEADTLDIILWSVLTPLPLLVCFLPLAKHTLPLMAQLACLQGEIVWELVSDIETQQEMAASAREAVLAKLQETIRFKMKPYTTLENGATGAASPLSRAMDDLFTEWDTNGDGKITKHELARGLSNIGVYLSSMQLRELFRLADPDHSRYIDPEEFREFLADLQSVENDVDGNLSRQVTLRLQLRHKAEEEAHPHKDECGLFSAAFDRTAGGEGGARVP